MKCIRLIRPREHAVGVLEDLGRATDSGGFSKCAGIPNTINHELKKKLLFKHKREAITSINVILPIINAECNRNNYIANIVQQC